MPEVGFESINKIKRIYFVGIKGVGMASLAIIAKEAGFIVSGSDVPEEFITDKVLRDAKISIDTGFEISSLEDFIQESPQEALVITTAAHGGLNNPQSKFALENNIKILTHGQAVGFFMRGDLFKKEFEGISILGCHGKTTITAMTAVALEKAGLNPTYSVGTSEIFPIGAGGHYGSEKYFIAEADEFISDVEKDRTVKFLYQYPKFAIINNIDFDHPDVYKDIREVEKTFLKFASENIKDNGVLIINGDDKVISKIKHQTLNKRVDLKIITYGGNRENDVRIGNFRENGWGSEFEVVARGQHLGKFNLSVPGFHNAKNSLSVIALMLELEADVEDIKKALELFQGTKRRQEKIGETKNGAVIVDDYAHHPEEIIKTIDAVKKAFPDRKVVCLFQPHTLGRTKALKEEFTKAFSGVDEVIFLPIFTSKREGEVNYDQLYDSIKKIMQDTGLRVYFPADSRTPEEKESPPYFYEKNRAEVVKYILEHYDNGGFVVLTLGAGDLYRIAYDLVD